MNINLPDHAESMLREAMAEDGEAPEAIPSERLARRQREIETCLLEAHASGPGEPMTPQHWEELKRRVWVGHP